ncbi:MAG: hypothetical protein COW60_00470 [Candidatus Yonathbacteria bacterium CG17_big_fil_post_rev_8_21_14_2_50_43_9]|uniref:DUF5667 domain-containing protein n=1 Tax=Candidatus Yonathbacteria bacterium CG_4_10_14_0_8_um_filter_43_17 TaxID=1975099 RepID=A0A2M7Q520_9BACT|nr:MAG: hypothetical protein COW60_00470 [Candidatus Yonathbacteria bacterium CG17_big_fil_post_rev_8_21_14_2_50_43_9]PIY58185.1 MAG: hypothetical protein COY98_03285 [Candidatus Yonathbacteria bacterium CG_4_10_14_0_8_um_filter_43_17]
MNKNISIALLTLLAFTGVTASAQTAVTTSADATVTTTNTSITGARTVGLPPKPLTRDEMEARAKALRSGATSPKQTQGASFGEKARLGATTTAAMKANREGMERRAKEMRASTTALRAKIQDEQLKRRFEQARKHTELVNRRLEAAIERVQKLSDRVAERLTILEAEGITTTVSRGHLAEAKTKLDEALTKVAGIKIAIENAFATATAEATTSTTPSTTPKNAMKEVQALVKDVAKTIQEAHRHVALSISTVKPGLNKPRPATTTPANTGTTTTATTTQ